MKPYYSEPGIEIYCGDCIEVMKEIPDKTIDMILTDPPYGIDFCSPRTNRKERLQNDKLDDWKKTLEPMFIEFKRIMSNCCCCCCCAGGGGETPVIAFMMIEAIKHLNLIQTLIWKKFIGLGWRYRPMYENILVSSKSKKEYHFFDTSKKCGNVIEGINQDIPRYFDYKPGYHDEHPTQKPIALMKKLITIHSLKGMIILDPFLGSGTTAIACKELGRKCIGIEINKKYCEMAKRKLLNTIPCLL